MFLRSYYLNSTAKTDLHLITHELKRAIQESGTKDGMAVILVPGGTAGVTLLESEKEVQQAYQIWVENQVPAGEEARPNRRSGSGSTQAHLRAALVGGTLSIPVQGGRPMLGAWQEVVLLDFEDKIGRREFIIQVMGEGGKTK